MERMFMVMLPDDVHARLKARAKDEETTMKHIILRALALDEAARHCQRRKELSLKQPNDGGE